jgi:hypothetical protein
MGTEIFEQAAVAVASGVAYVVVSGVEQVKRVWDAWKGRPWKW